MASTQERGSTRPDLRRRHRAVQALHAQREGSTRSPRLTGVVGRCGSAPAANNMGSGDQPGGAPHRRADPAHDPAPRADLAVSRSPPSRACGERRAEQELLHGEHVEPLATHTIELADVVSRTQVHHHGRPGAGVAGPLASRKGVAACAEPGELSLRLGPIVRGQPGRLIAANLTTCLPTDPQPSTSALPHMSQTSIIGFLLNRPTIADRLIGDGRACRGGCRTAVTGSRCGR